MKGARQVSLALGRAEIFLGKFVVAARRQLVRDARCGRKSVPGRDSIAAALDPANTKALYMVADGKRGHMFADTLQQHNANVAKWFAIRRERGEM